MGGSAEYKEGKKAQQQAINAIDEFLNEHSMNGRGGVYEGLAKEYISAIAAATLSRDRDMVVTVNRTAKNEYTGTDQQFGTEIYKKYDAMRKAVTQMYRNPTALKNLLRQYGITIQDYSIQNGKMSLTYSFVDKNGRKVTETTQFDNELSRFPGL